MSFAATKKRHASTSSKSRSAKTTGVRTKGKVHGKTNTARTTRTARSKGNYQSAPTPDRYKEIQQALATKGYFKGQVNGQWGPDSVDALRRFQGDQSLTQDGKLGSLSLIALGLGPKRITAQARPEPQTVAPNQANQPTESKQ